MLFVAIFVAAKMIRTALKRTYACLLLLILFTAYAGQKVHIFREDPLHFAAFSGDLVPDNGADCQVVERCVVDDFGFFPCLEHTQPGHYFFFEVLAVLHPDATCCKQCAALRGISLRAPPAA